MTSDKERILFEALQIIFKALIDNKRINFDKAFRIYQEINEIIKNICDHEWSPTEALNVPLHCLKCGVKGE